VTYLAGASSAVRPVLAGPARPAELLGVSREALYLRICEPPGALAVLANDALRLPCGLLLSTTSAELPLTALAPPGSAGFVAGDGAVSWTGPAGPVQVRAVREWAPARAARGTVAASALAAVQSELAASGCGPDIDPELFAQAADDGGGRAAVAQRLLGRGPGLTPAGDDVLAGFLIGTAAFGLDAAPLRETIAVLAPARTTALSAALLWHAARGECIDEVAAVAGTLGGREQGCRQQGGRGCLVTGAIAQADRHPCSGHAVSRLLAVGHSSGAALALGLVTAAESALAQQAVLADIAGAA
jgi:hypothetical protein